MLSLTINPNFIKLYTHAVCKAVYKFLVYFILLLPITCFAQFTLTGRVLNQTETKPVPNASVFLSNATIGDKTAEDGSFSLKNVPSGKYDLVISVIGFKTYRQTILVSNSNIKLPDVTIFPKTIALKGVTITIDPNRERNFTRFYLQFKKAFLGTSDFAAECKILNPELLDFDYDEGTDMLNVSSAVFLRVANKALGYNLDYLFTTFKLNTVTEEFYYEGNALFTEMQGDAGQQRHWQQNRDAAYEGSMMHFLRSALNDQLDAEGFRVLQMAGYPNPERPADDLIAAKIGQFNVKRNAPGYNSDSLAFWKKKFNLTKTLHTLVPFPLKKWDIVKRTGEQGVYLLGHNNEGLVIAYNKKHHFTDIKRLTDHENLDFIINRVDNKEITLVDFGIAKPLFDNNGRIVTANTIKFTGAWSSYRAPQFLPINYAPPQSTAAADTTVHIENKLNSFTATHQNEKVHLHLDRPWYGLGDTIWMKAYTVAGADHQLTTLSGVLYAELVNPGDTVVQRLNLQLNHGLAIGEMILPNTYKSGIYRLRAYTRLMMNDSSKFYEQKIVVGGLRPQVSSSLAATAVPKAMVDGDIPVTTAEKPDVRFFPEGGDMVNGLRSKVAVKIIDHNRMALEGRGIIIDDDNIELADFSTQHAGMGQFALIPLAGKHYKAKITFAGGTCYEFDLPKAVIGGFNLSVNAVNDSLLVKVAANDVLVKSNPNAVFYVMAQTGGICYYSAAGKLTVPVYTATIAKSRFPTGIVQFTVFSQNNEPLCERILFVRNSDQLNLKLSAKKQNYAPLEKVVVNLDAKKDGDQAVSGTFSVSVTDETKVPVDENAENTIFTDLLLTSELKGHIDNPNYYFINQTDKTRADLDLLMLTQGYRRFEWKKILSGDTTAITYRPETALSVSGTITAFSNKPIVNGKVRLTSVKDYLATDTTTDANGNFTFAHVDLSGTAKVVISAKKANGGDNVKIFIKQPVFPPVNKMPAADSFRYVNAPLLTAMGQTYDQDKRVSLKNTIQLKEVKIQRKRNPVFEPVYSDNMKYSANLNGPGHANQVLLSDQITACTNLLDCLQGKLVGVVRSFDQWGKPVFVSLRTTHITGGHPMALFIDGVQHGAEDISLVNPADVYSIEVLRSISYLSIYGSNAPDGALIITLKRGSDYVDTAKTVDGLITYNFAGYYKAREFYTPKYDTKNTTTITDDRKTIYWNPDIITDANGKASFEYFNAGSKGTYRVV